VAVGAYLVLSAPAASPTSSAPRITPVVGIQHVGVAFEQAW
jgi:hypothetical protein